MKTFTPAYVTLAAAFGLFNEVNAAIQIKKNFKFGEEIPVRFDIPMSPTTDHWLGIFRLKRGEVLNEALWSSPCGSQDYSNPSCDPVPQNGTVTFTAEADTDSDMDYPLSPGKYKACLMYENTTTDEEIEVKCKKFRVNYIAASYMCDTAVIAEKKTYSQGENVTVNFITTIPVVNSWIGIYKKQDVKNKDKLGDDYTNWEFASCDTKQGDSYGNCVNTKTSGSVIIKNAIAESGKYHACFMYDDNLPYKQFKCSNIFEVV